MASQVDGERRPRLGDGAGDRGGALLDEPTLGEPQGLESTFGTGADGTSSSGLLSRVPKRTRNALLGVFGLAAAVIGVWLSIQSPSFLYLLYIGLSLTLGAIATTTLAWMVNAWRTPDALADSRLGLIDLPATHSFSLIVPARHEEAVLEATLWRLIRSDHPDFEVIVVVGDDDPGTREAAERIADREPNLVRVVVDSSWPKSKPKALNTALAHCTGTITGVFDAEDVVHPALLQRVDQCFERTDADIVQAGVQLMNFRSSWLTVRNVLEYYFWFRSRLHRHARQRFIPLGGNTVFIRTEVLQAVAGWDPECLAEDCELGVRLSALGARTVVFYEPELVTREECPPTLGAFIRQRTRWNQGYLQTLSKGYWRRLPLRQRALGAYILSMPYVLALAWLMIPIAIVTAIAVKAPVGVTLISFLPVLPMLSILVVEIAGLGEFCRLYEERPSLRDYARLVVGLPLYQLVLTFACARAVAREARGARGWEKTAHLGLHLAGSADSVAPPEAASRALPRRVTHHRRAVASADVPTAQLGEDLVTERPAGSNVGPEHRPEEAAPERPLWTRLHGLTSTGAGSISLPATAPTGSTKAMASRLGGFRSFIRRAATSHFDLVVQLALLTVVGLVLSTNLLHWPMAQFDEGTYVANAWSLQHGRLAPYTYTYGHPPLAWLLIFVWKWASGIFGHASFSIDGGRQLMVVVNLVSCSLLYTLARRLHFARVSAAAAVILFALCPLGVFFHRAVLLDNPSVAFALAAFVLARTPERRLWAFAGSGACFAVSVLCKETTLVILPALVFAAVQTADRRTRRYCLTLLISFFVVIGLMYPLYATLKGELVPGSGHTSIIGAAIDQLFGRQGTGSLFDPHSGTHDVVTTWLRLDPWLLGAALALAPIALTRRSTRAFALAFLIQVVMILRPGYLPNMYVIGLLPWAALIVVGSIEALWRRLQLLAPAKSAWQPAIVIGAPALVVALIIAASWRQGDAIATTSRLDGPTVAAERWIVRHVDHQKRLIVTDDFWIYLLEHGFDAHPMPGGFYSRTVISYWPLDYDPAVRKRFPHGWRDFDYIVANQDMRVTTINTPSAAQALKHSQPVASFGHGYQLVEIRAIKRTHPLNTP